MSCVNWGLCNNSICVLKRSLNISAPIESPQHVDLCYHRAYREHFVTGFPAYKCAPGDYLDSSHVRSHANATCTYHQLGNHGHNTSSFLSKSQCGYSRLGHAFCDYMEGDELHSRTLAIVADFWKQKPNCHVNNAFGCDHAESTPGYWTARGIHYEIKHARYL
jgi:hypothetical protein